MVCACKHPLQAVHVYYMQIMEIFNCFEIFFAYIDIDECIQSSCNGTCINTNGSYHCSCPVGYFYDAQEGQCVGMSQRVSFLYV